MSNIAYLRVSHTESLNGTSLEVQEKRCKAFAELHNFNIDYVYSEIVSGGVEFRKRPVFQKVLKELKSGSKLVVSRLDRLSRKVVDTLSLIDDFKKQHKEICITDIGNIMTDGVSKIFVTILASLAEIERENISIRIKASKKIAREERKHLGGYVEIGYKKDENGKLVPDDKEFEIVKSIFSLRKSGLKIRQISDLIKNKFGRTIHFTQCHRILNREHNQKLLNF
jgi:site-specific DNA recombinase